MAKGKLKAIACYGETLSIDKKGNVVSINSRGQVMYVEITAEHLDQIAEASSYYSKYKTPPQVCRSSEGGRAVHVRSDENGIVRIGCQRIKPRDVRKFHLLSLRARKNSTRKKARK